MVSQKNGETRPTEGNVRHHEIRLKTETELCATDIPYRIKPDCAQP